MALKFRRADGVVICRCGCKYSPTAFAMCPECGDKPKIVQKKLRLKIWCSWKKVKCAVEEDLCCVSCGEFDTCDNVCDAAKSYEGDIPCEHMRK